MMSSIDRWNNLKDDIVSKRDENFHLKDMPGILETEKKFIEGKLEAFDTVLVLINSIEKESEQWQL